MHGSEVSSNFSQITWRQTLLKLSEFTCTVKRVASQNLFYLFIPSRERVIVTGRKGKYVSAIAPEFSWPKRRGANEKPFTLEGVPLSRTEDHYGDVLPWFC